MPSRSEISRSAADTIADRSSPVPRALVGFDGFIDSITHVVDRRTDMTPSGYVRFRTIGDFAARCAQAAGKSANIERVLIEDRFGGNGPLLASALAALDAPTTFIGAIGETGAHGRAAVPIHPTFRALASQCERAIAIGPPSTTLCLEFDDGKLMFNDTGAVQAVTWERIVQAVGIEELVNVVNRCRLIGVVNWSLIGGVPGIWAGLARDVLPRCDRAPRSCLIDLSDPAKRSDGDIGLALRQLRELDRAIPVTLGLNLSEAERLAKVLGLGVFERHASAPLNERALAACRAIRDAADLDCVTVHPREGAAAADRNGTAAWFDGPYTRTPTLSTGAGDHYNGGFGFARTLGLSIEQCIAVGCAVSGAYVRDAASPARDRVVEFLRDLPEPER